MLFFTLFTEKHMQRIVIGNKQGVTVELKKKLTRLKRKSEKKRNTQKNYNRKNKIKIIHILTSLETFHAETTGWSHAQLLPFDIILYQCKLCWSWCYGLYVCHSFYGDHFQTNSNNNNNKIFDRNFNGLISDPSANIYCIKIANGFGVYNAWK